MSTAISSSHRDSTSAAQRFALLALLRPLHWSKNLLLLLPVALAHELWDSGKLVLAGWGMVAFSACASAGYIWNDLWDRDSDRQHATKRQRPLASHAVSVTAAVLAMGLLMAASVGVATTQLPLAFLRVLAAYLILSCGYSLLLKRLAIVDVIALGALYTIRLVAGGAATGTPVSAWLLTFAMFFFASLAFAKRYVELDQTPLRPDASLQGRGYLAADVSFLSSTGPICGYLSVLVLALYVNSVAVRQFYTHAHLLWMLCPLIFYWVSRLWLLAKRGELHEDPVLFAVTDVASWITALACVGTVIAAR